MHQNTKTSSTKANLKSYYIDLSETPLDLQNAHCEGHNFRPGEVESINIDEDNRKCIDLNISYDL